MNNFHCWKATDF